MCKYDWRPSFRQHKQKNTLETEVTQLEASCTPEEDYYLSLILEKKESGLETVYL